MDELVVEAEADRATYVDPSAATAFRSSLERQLRTTLGVRTLVRLAEPGALPRTEFKARRVVDNRDLYRGTLRARD